MVMYVLGHGEDVYDVKYVIKQLFYNVNFDEKKIDFGTLVPKYHKGILYKLIILNI